MSASRFAATRQRAQRLREPRRELEPRTVAEWVTAVSDLRKVGAAEWAGPCPICGGEDRFSVRPGKRARALIHCRHGCDFRSVAEAVFPSSAAIADPWRARTRPESPPAAPKPSPVPEAGGAAGELWARAVSAEATPAARYLRQRLAWPPAGDPFPAIPEAIRWIRRENVPLRIPEGAVGCTAFRFTRGGSILGVQLEALDGSARRLDRRWRRCIGTKSGAVFEIGPILGIPALAVRIVEGEASALAAALAWPRQLIRATGGTSGFRIEALEGLPGGLAAILDGDGDPAGRRAAAALERVLRAAGRKVVVAFRSGTRGTDAADELAECTAEAIGITGGEVTGWHRALPWLKGETQCS